LGASRDMLQMDLRYFYEHLKHIGKVNKIDLMLHSYGGDVTVPWRLVNLIKQFCTEFNVIIPFFAFSAATLTSMGADSIVMLPAATLGPTDPSYNGPFVPIDGIQQKQPINVEDITSYLDFVKEDLKIESEEGRIESLKILSQSDTRIHPMVLGGSKRTSKLARKYATDLLSLHMNPTTEKSKINKIVKTFSSDLYQHDHPINREEAKRHGLKIIIENPQTEALIWQLYEAYEDLMDMNEVYDFTIEFKKVNTTPLQLSTGTNIFPITITLPALDMVIIGSESLSYTYQILYEVTGLQFLDPQSNIKESYNSIIKSVKWVKDP